MEKTPWYKKAISDVEEGGDITTYDLFNLVAFRHDAVELSEEGLEQDLMAMARATTQLLVQKYCFLVHSLFLIPHWVSWSLFLLKRIFELPVFPSETGPAAVLAEETTRLPREKRIPEVKPLTRWEKFAKEKGIKNKKRERMVHDEDTDEFRPRYGYKRAENGIEEMPIVEVKHGSDPYADPWAAARVDKKERVAKNATNQAKNQLRAQGKPVRKQKAAFGELLGKVFCCISIELQAYWFVCSRSLSWLFVVFLFQILRQLLESLWTLRKEEGREAVTASTMPCSWCNIPRRKIVGKKWSFRDNFEGGDVEKVAMKAQLRAVADKVDKKARGVTNSLAAYEGIIPDAPSDSFRKKKGKGKEKAGGKSGGSSDNDTRKKRRQNWLNLVYHIEEL